MFYVKRGSNLIHRLVQALFSLAVGVLVHDPYVQAEGAHPTDAFQLNWGNVLTNIIHDYAAALARASSIALVSCIACTHAGASDPGDDACFFEATLSDGAESSYVYSGQQGGLVLALDESGYTGIRFIGDSSDMADRTMMMWPFGQPLPIGGTGPASTTINASLGSALRGQSFSSRDMSNGKMLAPLEVNIAQREPLSPGDRNAVRLAGSIHGKVSVIDRPNPPVIASLNIRFHGEFSFRPPGPYSLNCDSVSY